MLQRLALQQFVIVENSALEFGAGLNALTGETGAGKSILVDALTLLTGGRGHADWIRAGAAKLVLEGAFDLKDQPAVRATLEAAEVPLDEEDILLVRREISRDGRSRSFANGRQVLVSDLRKWCAELVWIVGQGEQRALLSSRQQEQLLDRLARSGELALRYRSLRHSWMTAKARLDQLRQQNEEFRAQEDWLAFQVQELEEAQVRPGERDELLKRRRGVQDLEEDLRRADLLGSLLVDANGSIADHVETLLDSLQGADETRWKPVVERLEQLREDVRELRSGLPEVSAELDHDPELIEDRLRQLGHLERKYGASEILILDRLATLQSQLETGRNLDRSIRDAEKDVAAACHDLGQAGSDLSAVRHRAAGEVESRIGAELAQLGMPGASLEFQFTRENASEGVPIPETSETVLPLEGGLDRISLRFQSHGSIDWGELGRVASGGELSRVLLALQAILGEGAPPRTWVFDEIDQGIGGETAKRVGERLERMSHHTQVLLVTHLPTIAALADRHQCVTKTEEGGRPLARVETVSEDERLGELARMLSGDAESKIARDHAGELLAESMKKRSEVFLEPKGKTIKKKKSTRTPAKKSAVKRKRPSAGGARGSLPGGQS